MRPTISTLLLAFLSLLPAAASAGTPASTAAAAAAQQALPPAELPEPVLVPVGEKPAPLAPSLEEDDAAAAAAAEPAIAHEIEEQSAEIEDVRKAEERVQGAPGDGDAARAASGLGLESPLRDRVEGALGRTLAPPPVPGGRVALLPELDHDLGQLQSEYDIPIEVNEDVVSYVRFFQTQPARGHFAKWLGRAQKYLDKYRAILREEGIPQDTVYLAMIESGFGNFAYSRARAVGPWQFISATGRTFGLKQDFWVDERRDPEKSARAAARYLKQLHEQTGDWRLAWAGYNAGVGRIYRAKALGYDDFWDMAATRGRRVLRAETKGYVPKLMAAAIISKHPQAFGFRPDEIDPATWTDYDEVTIPSATLLSVVARAAGISERDVVELNPELRRACTPPRSYALKLPKATADTFARNWPELSKTVRLTFAGHVVRRGETLGGIASRYGVEPQGILEMNGLRNARKLRVGLELLVPRPVGAAPVAARAEPAGREETERRAHAVRAKPAPTKVAAAPRQERGARQTFEVHPGDTLWSISQKYGVELADLCRWNGIKDPRHHKLQVGAHIVVLGESG